MTAQEKERITRLRGEGKSYGAIATLLGISPSKVKSYCIRHELGGARSSVGIKLSKVSFDATDGKVHLCHFPCCRVGVLTEHRNLVDVPAGIYDEFCRLNEHTTRPTAGI